MCIIRQEMQSTPTVERWTDAHSTANDVVSHTLSQELFCRKLTTAVVSLLSLLLCRSIVDRRVFLLAVKCVSWCMPEPDVATPYELVDSLARNYFRLARLTLIAGTDQIRRCVLDRLPAGETLHSALERNRNKMDGLLRRHVISEKQWLLLYPVNSNVNLARIDITLWITLLRNIVPLSKLGVRNIRWNDAPNDNEIEWFHDVLRIRETRNSLAHLLRPELDNDSFERLWIYVSSALQRLDW